MPPEIHDFLMLLLDNELCVIRSEYIQSLMCSNGDKEIEQKIKNEYNDRKLKIDLARQACEMCKTTT